MNRVADLMGRWADALGLQTSDGIRWRAAGLLHDAMKDAGTSELRALAEGAEEAGAWGRSWPDPVLHAPACAVRLRRDGVDDPAFLLAIAFHPLGHPEFDRLGEALYLADFLEPGRDRLADERARIRETLPGGPAEWRAALLDVTALRFGRLLDARKSVRPEMLALWNRVVADE